MSAYGFDPQGFVDGWNDAADEDGGSIARLDDSGEYISDGPAIVIDITNGRVIITSEGDSVIVGCEIDDPNDFVRSGTVDGEVAVDGTLHQVYGLALRMLETLRAALAA